MKKTTLAVAALLACAFIAPAQALSIDPVTSAKKAPSADLVAKKGKSKKAKKAKA